MAAKTLTSATNTALVDNLVRIVNGLPKTETPRISELFNRPHRFVMRSIDKLIENGAINACSVARISYKDSKNREQRAYQLGERESLILMPLILEKAVGGPKRLKWRANVEVGPRLRGRI